MASGWWLVAVETETLGVEIRFPLRCVVSSDPDLVPTDPATSHSL